MAPTKLNDIAHRRFNPLNGTWVLLVSPQKLQRPRQGQKEALTSARKREHDPNCYLCPRNLRATGNRNPDYASTFIFENDYSTVRMDEGEYVKDRCEEGTRKPLFLELLRAQPVIGRCYVLTYFPHHDYAVSDMTCREVYEVVEAWTRVYARYLSLDNPLRMQTERHSPIIQDEPCLNTTNLRYMQIFDNNGEIVGCSNPHPHGQIWITSSMPDEPRLEAAQLCKYREDHDGRHLLGDYVQLEMDRKERIVWQNDGFLVVCPWWAIWPFEVLLLPKRHVRALVDFSHSERLLFAEAILQITKIYDKLFGSTFPYISGLYQAPLNATDFELETSYLHMHFSPPLLFPSIKNVFGGCELYGELTREIPPEVAASHLRRAATHLTVLSLHHKPTVLQEQVESVLLRVQEITQQV